MPVHVRGGQIVPRQPGGMTTAATVAQPIDLLVVLPRLAAVDCGNVVATGELYLDDGETVLDQAAAAHVSFAASWKMEAYQEVCVAGGRPLGLTMAVTEFQADAVVPDVATITVLGLECPPGDVTVGGQAATATWYADLGKAVIDVPAGMPCAAISLDYTCGSWGSYTLSEAQDAARLDPRTDLQGLLTFVPNEQVVYGALAPISPLTVHVAAMSDPDTMRVRVFDPNDARWEVPGIVQEDVPGTTPAAEAADRVIEPSHLELQFVADGFTLSVRRWGGSPPSHSISSLVSPHNLQG